MCYFLHGRVKGNDTTTPWYWTHLGPTGKIMNNDDPFCFPYESSRSTNRFLSNHWVIYSCTSLTDAYQKSLYISLPSVFFSVNGFAVNFDVSHCDEVLLTLAASTRKLRKPHRALHIQRHRALHIQRHRGKRPMWGDQSLRDQWVWHEKYLAAGGCWPVISLGGCVLWRHVGQVEELRR